MGACTVRTTRQKCRRKHVECSAAWGFDTARGCEERSNRECSTLGLNVNSVYVSMCRLEELVRPIGNLTRLRG
ncbi:hypothetical protein M404DRAFT_200165 [Pisolithus tinctorius Marx 270]|uniref:Uncharacterized protein n=1 Tax=Pisolithus tinctorius Marx 270 TaxID=870435 RepID=A0A0C3KZX9_PISTI|nr:hypothetical protein M404DRAFT_200165 [Pisolithus tinctorius Marx 270]